MCMQLAKKVLQDEQRDVDEGSRHDNLGCDHSGHDNTRHQEMEVGEGSRLVALIGMVEHIRLAKSVKENITYRNLDHLFAMDMDKLKSLVHIGSYNQNSCYVFIDVKFYW